MMIVVVMMIAMIMTILILLPLARDPFGAAARACKRAPRSMPAKKSRLEFRV